MAEFTTVINSPPQTLDDIDFIGSDTQLNIYSGSSIPDYFRLGHAWSPSQNIEVNLLGGTIGENFSTSSRWVENTDVVVNIVEGVVGRRLTAEEGSTVSIYGGEIGEYFRAGERTVVRIFGGDVGDGFSAGIGSSVSISGGRIGNRARAEGANFVVSGGSVGKYFDALNSTVAISGGAIADIGLDESVIDVSGGTVGILQAYGSGNRVNLTGGDFRLDGVPIPDLSALGSSVAIDIPSNGVLTGTLADGSPIAISQQGYGDYLPSGALTLHAASYPAAIPQTFRVPTSAPPNGLRAGQRLFVTSGGQVPDNFTATWGSTVDVAGGDVGGNFEAGGATVTIVGGRIGGVSNAYAGSIVNISGGFIDSNFTAGPGSTVNVSGGTVDMIFEALGGSVVNYSGGTIRQYFQVLDGSQLNITGGEFRLNGVPIAGLTTIGDERSLNLPRDAVLSGTLADGTPFIFTGQAGDYVAEGALTLRAAQLPTPSASIVQVPSQPAPKGLRGGQSLVLTDGGTIGDDFTASWGSTVNISGGQAGYYLRSVGAMLNMSAGSVGSLDVFHGSMVNVTGGSIGGLRTYSGSVVNFSGGTVEQNFSANPGSLINISGGSIPRYAYAYEGSVLNISDGYIGNGLTVYGATVNVTGGSIGNELRAESGTTINLSGGDIGERLTTRGLLRITGEDFRIDGIPVAGLDYDGSEVTPPFPVGAVISGTLADGTPFAFSASDADAIESGALRLQRRSLPLATPSILRLPNGESLRGVRGGQTLLVSDGADLHDNFNAGWGSAVKITGGRIGDNFEAVGAQVTISGGTIGRGFDAFIGSEIMVTGGAFGNSDVRDSTGTFTVHSGAVARIGGGTFEKGVQAFAGSEVHLVGTQFFLDGAPIGAPKGETVEITARQTSAQSFNYPVLTGTLLDGSTFRFALKIERWNLDVDDFFDPLALLTITTVTTADFNGDGAVDGADLAAWQSSSGNNGLADADGDLDVDGNDFLAWQRQVSTSVGGTAAVPESPSIALLLTCGSLFALQRIGASTARRRASFGETA